MEPEFITYQKFDDIALANALMELLTENDIAYLMEEEGPVFDPSFSFKELLTSYAIKIKSSDFERVNQLLEDDVNNSIDTVDKDYYLFDFTDDELVEVITKADEWNTFDTQLARKIMADRGKTISDSDITQIKEKRIEELKVPDEPQTGWIVIGYIFAFLGGLLGLFIGWYLFTYKKTLPNGEKVYGYSANDRKQGYRIFFIAVVMLIVSIIARVIIDYNY